MGISRWSLACAAALILPIAGCGGVEGRPSAAPLSSTASQAPTEKSPASDRLATASVADWTGFPDAGQGDVTFHLSEHCATAQGGSGEPVMLVWPDGMASISPEEPDTVRLREPVSGKVTEVSDGQRVNLGGTPITGLKKFVIPPHSSCPIGRLFLVTQINSPQAG